MHATYFTAGATVGISASYQASRTGFERDGLGQAEADRLLALSVALVREARESRAQTGATQPMLVAASVGPYGATLHDGSEYRGRYGVAHEDLVAFHRERLDVLVAAAPDLLAIETVPDLDEARAIVEALQGYAVPSLAVVLLRRRRHDVRRASRSRTPPRSSPRRRPSTRSASTARSPSTSAGSSRGSARRSPTCRSCSTRTPDASGTASRRVWLGDGTDLLPRRAVESWFDAGVSLVGGCCGLGPAAIADVAATADARG